MQQNQTETPTDDIDTTMTGAGEKTPGEDPDFDDQVRPQDDREPEVLPDDPDIQGIDGSGKPS